MKPYEKYKESGVEWIGDIPVHWKFIKLKYILSVKSGDSLSSTELSDDYDIPVYGGNGIMGYTNKSGREGNEIIIGRVGAHCGNIHLATGEKWVSDNALVVETNYKLEYLTYLLKSINLNKLANKNAQPLITGTMVKDQIVAFPNILEEQAAIAKYLDHQTGIIDELIEKKTRQIALLKEKRQTIINETVTKGLDPTAKMKDSGIEWLGEIPEGWEVKKLKFVYNIKKQIAGELGYNVLSVTQKGIKIRDLDNLKGQLSMDYSKYQLVEKGDFIMNHMDLLTGFIDISNWNGVTSPDYRVFHSIDKNCIDEYYLFIFQFCYSNKIFFGLGQGVSQLGRWRMPAESFNNFIVPYPSKEKQQQIVDFLIGYTKVTDKAIEKQLVAIEKLKEYRQSLISEAVTGKIDVRGWGATTQPKA